MPDQRPVFLFFFANADAGSGEHLRGLAPELERLRRHGHNMLDATGVEARFEPDATRDHLIRLLTDPALGERVVGVHFAGHAGPDRWMMRADDRPDPDAHAGSAAAHSAGVLELLGKLPSLALVVLNGCSTGEQAGTLLAAGVPAVIATDCAIADDAALIFSDWLYQGLVRGSAIQKAFDDARDAVRTHRGPAPADMWRMGRRAQRARPQNDLPWTLGLDPEESERAAGWRLADALGDPLAGLPAVPDVALPDSPYRHVRRFTAADAQIFFGRGPEIRRLYRCITEPNTPPIVLLYGESGVGKSSLLEAGVMPRLEAAGLSVRMRRRDPSTGLLGALRACLGLAAGDTGPLDWAGAEARAGRPIVAIVDQVEEALLDGEGDGGLGALLDAAVATFETGAAVSGRLVLGFRKGYLAEVVSAMQRRGLPGSRVYVRPLDRNAVIEVVEGPTSTRRLREHFQLELQDGLAERIADDLTAGEPAAVAPILQMLLSRMWEAATTRPVVFDDAAYDRARRGGVELVEVFERQLAAAEAEAGGDGLLLDLLAHHITRQGTAAAHTLDALGERYPRDALPALINAAVDHRLLGRWTGERDARGGTRLAHDMWGPMVVDTFHRSGRPGQRARRIVEMRARAWTPDEPPLDDLQLAEVERGLDQMRRLTETEEALLEAGRVARRHRSRDQKRNRVILVGGLVLTVLFVAALMIVANLLEEKADTAQAVADQRSENVELLMDSSWLAEARDHLDDGSVAATALLAIRDRHMNGWTEIARRALTRPIARDWFPAVRLIGFDPSGRLVVLTEEEVVRVVPETGARTVEPAPPWPDAPLALDTAGRVVALVPVEGAADDAEADRGTTLELRTADGEQLGEAIRCPEPRARQVDSPRWLFAATCAGEPRLIDRHGLSVDLDAPPAVPEGLEALVVGRSSRVADVDPWAPGLMLCTTLDLRPPWPALSGLEWIMAAGGRVERNWREGPSGRSLDAFCPSLAFNPDGVTGVVLYADGLHHFSWDQALGRSRFETLIERAVPRRDGRRPAMRYVDRRRVAVDVPDGSVNLVDVASRSRTELKSAIAFPRVPVHADPLAPRMRVDATGRWLADLRGGAVRLWSLERLDPLPPGLDADELHQRLDAATRGCPTPETYSRVLRHPTATANELWRVCVKRQRGEDTDARFRLWERQMPAR